MGGMDAIESEGWMNDGEGEGEDEGGSAVRGGRQYESSSSVVVVAASPPTMPPDASTRINSSCNRQQVPSLRMAKRASPIVASRNVATPTTPEEPPPPRGSLIAPGVREVYAKP